MARVIPYLLLISIIGIFTLTGLRNLMILDWRLPFPSGTATGIMLNSFHSKARAGLCGGGACCWTGLQGGWLTGLAQVRLQRQSRQGPGAEEPRAPVDAPLPPPKGRRVGGAAQDEGADVDVGRLLPVRDLQVVLPGLRLQCVIPLPGRV
jgi:hypothetical protein